MKFISKLICVILSAIILITLAGCNACGANGIQTDKIATVQEHAKFRDSKDWAIQGGTFSVDLDLEYESIFAETKYDDDGAYYVVTETEISAEGFINFDKKFLLSATADVTVEKTYTTIKNGKETKKTVKQVMEGVGVFDDYAELWYIEDTTTTKENGNKSTTNKKYKDMDFYTRDLNVLTFPVACNDLLEIILKVFEEYPTSSGRYFFIDGDDCMLLNQSRSKMEKTAFMYNGSKIDRVHIVKEDANSSCDYKIVFRDKKNISVPSDANTYEEYFS